MLTSVPSPSFIHVFQFIFNNLKKREAYKSGRRGLLEFWWVILVGSTCHIPSCRQMKSRRGLGEVEWSLFTDVGREGIEEEMVALRNICGC